MNKRTLLLCGTVFFLSLQNAYATTYADLQTAFSRGGTLELDSDVDFTGKPYMGNDLLINGNGYTLDGGGNYGGINTTSSSGKPNTLSLENITMQNMYSSPYGGVVNSYGYIGTFSKAKFLNNSAGFDRGGAVYLQALDRNKKATFDNVCFNGNHLSRGSGGAVFSSQHFALITRSEFNQNYIDSIEGRLDGGAFSNHESIDEMSDTIFTKNYIKTTAKNYILGGALHNQNSINLMKNITFSDNYLYADNAATQSGALNDQGYIKSMSHILFDHNRALSQTKDSVGGAMTMLGKVETMDNITFVNNYAYSKEGTAAGGAMANGSRYATVLTNGVFENNYAKSETNTASGGALFNDGKFGDIINSRFINNYVQGDEESSGGAIFSTMDLSLISDNGLTEFSGNTTNGESNAIFMANAAATLSLISRNNGVMRFDDTIDGIEGYGLKIDGEASSVMAINNKISNANIELNTFDMAFENVSRLNHNNSLTIKSGSVSIADLGSDKLKLRDLGLNGGDIKIGSVDVDLAGKDMGRIIADTASTENGKLVVDSLNLTSDAEEDTTAVLFAQEGIADAVVNETDKVSTALYNYGVKYDPESGEFIFTRTGFTPVVFANSVFMKASANSQEETVTKIIEAPRIIDYSKARVWATPYYSDDTLGFSNFYDVDSKNYGLIAGIDTRAFGNPDGWNSVYTLFGAYNDGENKYQGVKVDGKSWLVGLKASIYNGGFYGDAIVNYAWHDSDQTTAFGKDSVDSNGYGAALKAGYKHEFENKFELDTSAMLSWQEVQGEDFTSKSGARISTDDYSRLTLTPQVKLGYSFEKVRPYALVRYNFVLDEDGSSTVNNIALPTIESKDYIEYGLGVETTDAFPHGGYAHVLSHDGGRSGWSVTAGYRFNF